MARYSVEDTTLTNIADAIREKTGESGAILVNEMAEKISGISSGGTGNGDDLILNEVTITNDNTAATVVYNTLDSDGAISVATATMNKIMPSMPFYQTIIEALVGSAIVTFAGGSTGGTKASVVESTDTYTILQVISDDSTYNPDDPIAPIG